MSWAVTVDERYKGGIFSYSAGTYDALYSTSTEYKLAPRSYAYGALIPVSYSKDKDAYSLGILSPGVYAAFTTGYNWDYTNLIFASTPTAINLHDPTGAIVLTNTLGSLYFTVYQTDTFYISVEGSNYSSSEYSLVYTPNYSGVATIDITGLKSVGSTLSATYTVTDANGALNITPSYQWASSSDGTNWTSISGATSSSYSIKAADADKYLRVGFAYTDNDGFIESFVSQSTTKIAPDTINPSLIKTEPAASSYIGISQNINLYFSENIQKGNGSIYLKKMDGSLIQSFDVANSSEISVNDTVLTINLTANLAYDTQYKIEISNSAIKDFSGNSFTQTNEYNVISVSPSSAATPSSSPFAIANDDVIDAMTSGYKWSLSANKTIDWSISNGLHNEYWTDPNAVITHVKAALDLYSYYSDIKFNYLGYFNNPNDAYTYGSEINVSMDGVAYFSIFSDTRYAAIGNFPTSQNDSQYYIGVAGDIYLNILSAANNYPSYEPGSEGWQLLIHEIGHTLGLKHPHNTLNNRPTLTKIALSDLDIDWATVMSYNDNSSFSLLTWDPATPMVLDVLAMQYLYGKNSTTNSGDTLFNLDETNFYATIYDASGNDTVNIRNTSAGWSIFLPNFKFTNLVDTQVGFAIPSAELSSVLNGGTPKTLDWLAGNIENATGSNYSDLIAGSDLANYIAAGAGDDIIVGSNGTDTLIGGDGADTVKFLSNRSEYIIYYVTLLNQPGYSYGYKVISATDSNNQSLIIGVESISFLDGTYTLAVIAPPDTTAPTASSFSPADEASAVAIASNIVVTFSENIQRGAGNIVLKTSDGTTVATYAQGSSNVTISGSTLTINPTADLSYSTGYKVEFASGSVQDLAGNDYAGTTSYNFTSAVQGANSIASGVKISNWRNGSSISDVTISDGQPVKIAPIDKASSGITLTDVLAALKIYLGKSLPDAYASPFNYIAADFDGNGSVNLTDVLSLLKFYLGKTTTAAPTWVFVDAADVIGAGKTASILRAGSDSLPIDATHTQPHAIDQDFSKDSSIELVGVLRGDVDGSWTAGS